MTHPIDTLEYWVEDFSPTADELEALYAHVLDEGMPQDLESLGAELIRRRVEKITARRQKSRRGAGAVYAPSDSYEEGQKLVFPALDGKTGTVQSVREGNNPAYGEYEVITVRLADGNHEFAAGLETPHLLTAPDVDVEPEAVAERFASIVAPGLATVLASDDDWVHYGDSWILTGLLPDVNQGHLNLAEAVIMVADGPVSTEELAGEMEFKGKPKEEACAFALVLALSGDNRFRNVGALEAPLWALTSDM